MAEHPYRAHPDGRVEVPIVRVPAADCQRCRFNTNDMCLHPLHQDTRRAVSIRGNEQKPMLSVPPHPIRICNPKGQCPHWEPTWWGRWLIILGCRRPPMVDPRVWDEQ